MRIAESVQKILSQKEPVVDRFYELFFNRHHGARNYFAGVDMRRQAILLTMALITVESHYSYSYPATEHYLKVLGSRHHEMGVRPELYPMFRDCLIEAIHDFHGDDWNEDLAVQWREAIKKATATMLEGYERDYIY